jgi:hypothetical protein
MGEICQRKIRTLLFGLCALLAGVFALWLLHERHLPEPQYQGRSLTWWLNASGCSACDPGAVDYEAFSEAISAMGPGSVPVLLRHLRQPRRSAIRTQIESWLERVPWLENLSLPRTKHLDHPSLAAFEILGNEASQAIPALAQRLGRDDESPLAIAALEAIGPASITALAGALHMPNDFVRIQSIQALASFGTNSAVVIPDLTVMLHDPKTPATVRSEIAAAFTEFFPSEDPPISVLVPFLDEPILQEGAFIGLSRAGAKGWLILLEQLTDAATNSSHISAALASGATLSRFRHSSAPVHPGDRYTFSAVRSIYKSLLLRTRFMQQAGKTNAIVFHSLTNVVAHSFDNEDVLTAVLRVMAEIDDQERIASDCLEHLAAQHPSENVRTKARRVMLAREE